MFALHEVVPMNNPQSPIDDDAAASQARWYIVMSQINKEAAVHESLKGRGFDTLFLHYKETVRHARREEPKTRALFPRYVFVAIRHGQSLETIRWSVGVSKIVENADGPFEVPAPIIADLRARGNADGLCEHPDAGDGDAAYRAGQRVRITGGLLRGRTATIEIAGGRVIRVWVESDRGGQRVALDPQSIRPEP